MLDAEKILVSVTGDESDETIAFVACNLWRKKKVEIDIIYIIEVKRSLPLDAELEAETKRAEEVLQHVQHVIRQQDCRTETAMLQAREAGPAIVQEAMERGVDAIMLGLSCKTRFGKFDLTETVDYVIKNAPCHVLLYRGPPDHKAGL